MFIASQMTNIPLTNYMLLVNYRMVIKYIEFRLWVMEVVIGKRNGTRMILSQ